MALDILWFIPTHGDGRYLGTAEGGRATNLPYLQQIAQAVDNLGFSGALLPTGNSCDDAWVVASSLIAVTKRMKFLVAIRPGLTTPSLAARMAATFDRLSEGRLMINIVTGGNPIELAGDGLHLSHDERYELTDEFLTVWRELAQNEKASFKGRYFDIKESKLIFPFVQYPYPPLYFGGSSDAALKVAAKHVDVYLTWGEPPAAVAEKIAEVRQVAAAQNRTLRFGIRLHVIVRKTNAEAWQAANELIQYVDDKTIAQAQANFAQFDSVGQRRMTELHAGNRNQLEISPNLWAGVGLVRGGAGTALVGDPDTVAERMQEYAELGIDTFILSGYPHLEEAYRVSELLLPKLKLTNGPSISNRTATAQRVAPIGELIGNEHIPR